jgi:hypothetical protein
VQAIILTYKSGNYCKHKQIWVGYANKPSWEWSSCLLLCLGRLSLFSLQLDQQWWSSHLVRRRWLYLYFQQALTLNHSQAQFQVSHLQLTCLYPSQTVKLDSTMRPPLLLPSLFVTLYCSRMNSIRLVLSTRTIKSARALTILRSYNQYQNRL